MALSDGVVVLFIILALWLTLNIFTSEVENPVNDALNASTDDPDIQASLATIHAAQEDHVGLFADAAPFVIMSLLTIVIITNAFTNLNPFIYGIFAVIFMVMYYVVATWIIPVVLPGVSVIVTDDVAPDYLAFLTTNWNWALLSVLIGSIIGYLRGGENGAS